MLLSNSSKQYSYVLLLSRTNHDLLLRCGFKKCWNFNATSQYREDIRSCKYSPKSIYCWY